MNHSIHSRSTITNHKAIASLILGVIAILLSLIPLAGIIIGILGIILGIIGIGEIKRLKQAGKKIAVFGIVCSSIGILLPIIAAIIGYIVFMNIESTIY